MEPITVKSSLSKVQKEVKIFVPVLLMSIRTKKLVFALQSEETHAQEMLVKGQLRWEQLQRTQSELHDVVKYVDIVATS
jgi:hypothetical protein